MIVSDHPPKSTYGRSVQHIQQTRAVDVYTAAQMRVTALFDQYETLVVDFSGGKDSTVALHLALAEAQQRHRPLHVALSDEEAIDPDTLSYLEAVAAWPELTFHWCCAPVQHTLQGQHRQLWTCWDEAAEDVWIREPPASALMTHAAWTPGMSLSALMDSVPAPTDHPICHIVGIRCEESWNRRRALLQAGSYVTRQGNHLYAKPIYDWKTTDVWAVIKREGWPYSAYYDKAKRLNLARFNTRVAPIGNVSSCGRMHLWAQLYPVFWDRVLRRLPELDSMARYGRTRLYHKSFDKPAGHTWQEWTWTLVSTLPVDTQTYFRHEIARELVRWDRVHSMPYPEEVYSEIGTKTKGHHSWKHMAMIVGKHDQFQGASRDFQ